MKLKSLVLLAVALGCGLVAMLGVQQVLSGDNGQGEPKLKVLVAKVEIAPGQPLDEVVIGVQEWRGGELPPGAITDLSQLEGRMLKTRVFPGDLVLDAKLREKGKGGASVNIPEGMRVITLPVNMTSSNGGMINPGDRVDFMCTWKETRPGVGQVSRTKTFLNYIEVFAIDRVREMNDDETKSISKPENLSVIVTPEQAQILELAKNKGTLQIAMRNQKDKESPAVASVDDAIFSDLDPSHGVETPPDDDVKVEQAPVEEPVVPVPAKRVWTLQINEGDTIQKLEFELPEAEEATGKELDSKSSVNAEPKRNPVQSLFNTLLGL
ncbi:MAG: Flp pilus assembly protein CpaB [Planctomycetales bacterium]|nr:Flp pilus assembly protein CpaB [Planctomycetales bacterium]